MLNKLTFSTTTWKLKGNGYDFNRRDSVLIVSYSENESTLKGKKLHPPPLTHPSPPILEGCECAGKQTGSHTSCLSCENWRKNLPSISSALKVILIVKLKRLSQTCVFFVSKGNPFWLIFFWHYPLVFLNAADYLTGSAWSCWIRICTAFANSSDPDQFASSTLFGITYVNLYQ